MKHLFPILLACLCLAACKKSVDKLNLANADIVEYIETMDVYPDSITGYATYSANNRFVITSEELTKEQYDQLLTDEYVMKEPELIDKNSICYKELFEKSKWNIKRYGLMRNLVDDDYNFREDDCCIWPESIYYYKETKQYRFDIGSPMTTESFMISENGHVDTTYMQSETRSYGENHIFVGQKGHDCDFHGSLWFYFYDEPNHHMIPLCHYVDYRWSEETPEFNLCWISGDELLVSAISTGNSGVYGWAGGYRATNLAPYGTPVYYKLRLSYK